MARVGKVQYAVLEHLAAVMIRQKNEARATRKRFLKGWTRVKTSRTVRHSTLMGLWKQGLIGTCCSGHECRDLVRISRSGIEYLEAVRGETIYV